MASLFVPVSAQTDLTRKVSKRPFDCQVQTQQSHQVFFLCAIFCCKEFCCRCTKWGNLLDKQVLEDFEGKSFDQDGASKLSNGL